MVPLPLVGQKLVEVAAVGMEDVLALGQADEYGHDAVHSVEGGEGEQVEGGRALPSSQKSPSEDEGEADAADVAGKAKGALAEVKKEEGREGRHHAQLDGGLLTAFGQPDGAKEGQAVQAGDAVDAVHKVGGVEPAGEED